MMYTFPMEDSKYSALYYERPDVSAPVFEVEEAEPGCRLCCDTTCYWWEPIPQIAIDMSALITAKVAENDAACQARILSGFKSEAKGGEQRHYSFSYEHQINMMGIESQIMLDAIAGVESEILWKNSSQDVCEPWTAAEFNRLAADAKQFKTRMTHKHDLLQESIKACTTPAELEAIALDYETTT